MSPSKLTSDRWWALNGPNLYQALLLPQDQRAIGDYQQDLAMLA
jgi:hypothetical protein